MVNYDDALKMVLHDVSILEFENKATFNCTGQVLAEDIYSEISLPLKDSAILDGYAVRAIDIQNASKNNPLSLRVTESVRAGIIPPNPVKPGTAIRVMTGCILPEGADCLVRFEDTDETENKNSLNVNQFHDVKIFVAAVPGSNVRKAGRYVAKGNLLLPKGIVIGPNHLSILMSIGKNTIKVFRRPRAAIISVGDELINPGYPLTPGKVYNSNTAAISSLVSYYGGIPQLLGIARDYETSIASRIRKGLNNDIIITSGGIAKGDYDLVAMFMEKYGEIKLSKINMEPGASFSFGLITKMLNKNSTKPIPLFALSGPPAGCLINFETLVRPALLKMMGIAELDHPSVEAVADDSIPEKSIMAQVRWTELRWENGEYHVRLNEFKGKGLYNSLARANSLTVIPENTVISKGGKIKVLVLDWFKNNQSNFSYQPD